MINYWILPPGATEPLPAAGVLAWGRWFEEHPEQRIIIQTPNPRSEGMVSTVFLGLNHSFIDDETAPVLWETMVFDGPCDGDMYRYTSHADALRGHAQLTKTVFQKEVVEWWGWIKYITIETYHDFRRCLNRI